LGSLLPPEHSFALRSFGSESRPRPSGREKSPRSRQWHSNGTAFLGQHGDGAAHFPHCSVGRKRRVLHTRRRGVSIYFEGLHRDCTRRWRSESPRTRRQFLLREQHPASLGESGQKRSLGLVGEHATNILEALS